ncbi:MAG: HU family DNA-binding protein [Bacteroidaceae bacterium]|nr:HU family DNA-binding protein [Bacteroidaceae bacterium]
MAIYYEFYKTPNPNKDEEKSYHARVVTYNKVSTDQLASEIQDECSLTKTDVKAVLNALAGKIASHLGNGDKVFLEDIGYFSVNLQCAKKVTNHEDMKWASVRFKSVSFRADVALKNQLLKQKIYRSKLRAHSMPMSDEEIDAKLTEHFANETIITRRGFGYLCNQVRSTAGRIIKRLVEEGKLKNISTQRNPVYVPANGYYGS